MEVVAALLLWLLFFDLDAVSVGISVLTDASHLPRDFDVGLIGLDGEVIVFDLLGNNRLSKLAAETLANVPTGGPLLSPNLVMKVSLGSRSAACNGLAFGRSLEAVVPYK